MTWSTVRNETRWFQLRLIAALVWAPRRYMVRVWRDCNRQIDDYRWILSLPEVYAESEAGTAVKELPRLLRTQQGIERWVGRELIRSLALAENWRGPLPIWIEQHRAEPR